MRIGQREKPGQLQLSVSVRLSNKAAMPLCVAPSYSADPNAHVHILLLSIPKDFLTISLTHTHTLGGKLGGQYPRILQDNLLNHLNQSCPDAKQSSIANRLCRQSDLQKLLIFNIFSDESMLMYISLRTELYASQCEEDCSVFLHPYFYCYEIIVHLDFFKSFFQLLN